MSIFLNDIYFDQHIIKLVEASDDYIINGQVYDHQFIPKPMQFCPIKESSTNMMMINTIAQVSGSNYRDLVNENNVITDLSNPDKFYVLCNGINRTAGMIMFEKVNGEIKYKRKIGVIQDNCTQKMISQDKEHVFALLICSNSSNYYLCRYNLESDNYNSYTIGSSSVPTFLDEDSSNLYFVEQDNKQNISISKINKNSLVKEVLYSDSINSRSENEIVAVDKDKKSFYALIDEKNVDGTYKTTVKKYTFNKENEKVEKIDLEVDYGELKSFFKTDYSYTHFVFQVYEKNKNKYLILIPYNCYNNYYNLEKNFITIFKILDNKKIKLFKRINLQNKNYNSIIPIYNGEFIIACNSNMVSFFNWNELKETYEKTNEIIEPIQAIGIDKSYNIFLYKNNDSIDIISKALPIKVEADFEKDEYFYKQNDIESYVYIRAYNFFNKMLPFNYKMILRGPCKFTDTGLKEKIITTSDSDTIKIPITVYGQGSLEIGLKEIL